MADKVIAVENLGKQYRLGQVGSGTIASDLNAWWHRVRGKENPNLILGEVNDRSSIGNSNLVWALKDINFTVDKGEVLGIIGKNGAGKSTLLKILSKVTAPTVGTIKMKGRVASLLEVGTGFHPDLSGRDNIFLNGAILGMSRQEIRDKFDAIVEFSGVSRYIDTPVKRYSSGMYVRLAFAVAAHLEPEILIIDEVLAVGDVEFQKKCLGKMKDVSAEGRTVLFVSHNMEAVTALCSRTMCLKQGGIDFIGDTNTAIDRYLQPNSQNSEIADFRIKDLKKLGERVKIIGIEKLSAYDYFEFGKPLKYRVTLEAVESVSDIRLNFGIYSSREVVVGMSFLDKAFEITKGEVKTIEFSINTDKLLAPNSYLTSIGIIQGSMLGKYENLDVILGYPQFDIFPPPSSGLDNSMMNWRKVWGNILIPGEINKIG